jgi:nucleoid-associated protein YgaU
LLQRIAWYGSAAAGGLLIIAAVIGLRGAAPVTRPAPATSQAAVPTLAAPPPIPVAPPAAPRLPSFDVVTVTPQGQAVIAGRAAPGDKVRVLEDGKLLGEVTADQRGEWVLVPSAPIAPGDRQISAEATGKDGGAVRRSDDVVALSVKPPAEKTENTANLAVLVPSDTSKPAQMLQDAKPGIRQGLSFDTARSGAGNRLALAGHADPGARLNIYAGDQLLGTTTADMAGKWSLVAPRRAAAESFELRLEQLAENGSVARRFAAPFTPPPRAAARAAGRTNHVRQGSNLWLIAREVYGEGIRYTAIYSANRDRIDDPDQIYPGQRFRLPRR